MFINAALKTFYFLSFFHFPLFLFSKNIFSHFYISIFYTFTSDSLFPSKDVWIHGFMYGYNYNVRCNFELNC